MADHNFEKLIDDAYYLHFGMDGLEAKEVSRLDVVGRWFGVGVKFILFALKLLVQTRGR